MRTLTPNRRPNASRPAVDRPGEEAQAPPAGNGGLKFYLYPGMLFASSEPFTVTTILGSCVAVCLLDPPMEAGGMTHFLLPHWSGNGQSSTKFGNVAIRHLIEKLLALGCARRRLRAKIFGGASVLDAVRGSQIHLGAKNIELARQFLLDEGIPILTEDVGGARGRKLIFRLKDGVAWVKLL